MDAKEELKELVKMIKNLKGWTQEKVSIGAGYEPQGLTQAMARKDGHEAAIKKLKIAYRDILQDAINYNNPNTLSEPPSPRYDRFNIKMNPKFEPIPYHDIDLPAAHSQNVEMHDDKSPVAEDYYYIPEFSGCRAFNCFSDSMEPLIKKGSKIFARKLEHWQDYLEPGQVYVVGMLDGQRFLKYIKKASSPDKFLLVSENTHYEEFEIPVNHVRSIWLVDGSMDKRTQSTFFILKYPNNNQVVEPVITFGKHKGKKYSEVPHSYWRWLYDKHLRGEAVDKDILEYIENTVPDIKHQADKNKEK